MLAYTLRRIAGLVPTLFVLVTLSFFIIRLAPGGPFDQEQALSPAVRANLDAAYGLDQPLLVQYGRYLAGAGAWRPRAVAALQGLPRQRADRHGLPLSLTIGLAPRRWRFWSACRWARCAAWRRDSLGARLLVNCSLLGVVLPGIRGRSAAGAGVRHLLPVFRVGGYEPGDPSYLVLPVITLALPVTAYVARLTRDSMGEVLRGQLHPHGARQGTAAARGAVPPRIAPALIPVVSYLGPAVAFVITGSLVVESVFGLPGSGRYPGAGSHRSRLPLVMGMILVYGVFTLLCNLLADLLYGWLDPRVRVA